MSISWAVCCACCAFDKSNFKPCPLVLVGFLMRWFTPPPSIFSIRRPSGRGQNCGDWFCWSSQGTECSSDNIYLHKSWYAPGVHSKLNPSLKSARCFSGNYINRGWCDVAPPVTHATISWWSVISIPESIQHDMVSSIYRSLHLKCKFINVLSIKLLKNTFKMHFIQKMTPFLKCFCFC